jgi:hypothetical protein
MGKGADYLRLLRLDYERLIRDAQNDIEYANYMLSKYDYEPHQLERVNRQLNEHYKDIAFYRKKLEETGGAENEEVLTGSTKDSESPSGKFVGITCTTVL